MKRIVRLLFIFQLIIFTLSAKEEGRKKVAVVLSGGGAKGMAHIGALRVIEEAGIPIDMVVGTSMGSIIGGLYSIGYTPDQIDSMVNKQDWMHVLSDKPKRDERTFEEKKRAEKYVISLPFTKKPKESLGSGIMKGQNLANLFAELTYGYHDSIDFNTLPTPFACVAVDILTGNEFVFNKGVLSTAMRSSMSIPGVFEPVKLDNMILIDGGLKNNYPVNVAKEMGADIVIGVNVNEPIKKEENINTIGDILGQIVGVYGWPAYEEAVRNTDVFINVDLSKYTAASFSPSAIDSIRQRGEVTARAHFDSLLALKPRIGIDQTYQPALHGPFTSISKDTFEIRDIVFSGSDPEDETKILKQCKLSENSLITKTQIKNAVSTFYATMAYTGVTYKLIEVGNGVYDLHFTLEEKNEKTFNLGLRVDTEEFVAVLANGVFGLNTRKKSQLDAMVRFGDRTYAGLNYVIEPWMMMKINVGYLFKYDDFDLYRKGHKYSNYTSMQQLVEIGFSDVWKHKLLFRCGGRYQYLHYKNNILPTDAPDAYKTRSEGLISYYGSLQFDTFNEVCYPTKGRKARIDYSFYTDNCVTYNHDLPFSTLAASWQGVFSPGARFSIMPAVSFRYIWGNDQLPFAFRNMIGGNMFGRYSDHQIPFMGVGRVELADNAIVALRLDLRQRIADNNYITLTGNVASTDDKLLHILRNPNEFIYGGGLTYGYKTFFGPIEGSICSSNRTKKPYIYLNIGFDF